MSGSPLLAAASDLGRELDHPKIGDEIYGLVAELYPICRSITGEGVRDTLLRLSDQCDLALHEVPTGTRVLDWTIPREWNIRDAYIKDETGRRVVDFRASNLHVMSYSTPVHRIMPLSELKAHLFTLPDQPDVIPYRTSYYAERWGFCMTHRAMTALPEGRYEVRIDATLEDGFLTYGEHLHRGSSCDEVLFTTHVCHPSMANDNCSGMALLSVLADRLSALRTRYTYRFLFAPGTIGAITWLSRNQAGLARIKHGVVISGVGDAGGPTYKKSRRGIAVIDRIMAHVLRHSAGMPKVLDFIPYGYDERQYCSPGFDLPVGMFQRSAFATFPEYHTSADNLDFVAPAHLAASYRTIVQAIEVLENNWRPVNTSPKGEPQLGRRNLYSAFGGGKGAAPDDMAVLWVLNLADGDYDLLEIAERAGMPFGVIANAARALRQVGLLRPLEGAGDDFTSELAIAGTTPAL